MEESINAYLRGEFPQKDVAGFMNPVYGELLIRQVTGHATLLHPFLYVIDSKRALSFGEAQDEKDDEMTH
jgi:hypothetical protein